MDLSLTTTEKERIKELLRENRELKREGFSVAGCTVESVMRNVGFQGALRGRKHRTTTPGLVEERGWTGSTTEGSLSPSETSLRQSSRQRTMIRRKVQLQSPDLHNRVSGETGTVHSVGMIFVYPQRS